MIRVPAIVPNSNWTAQASNKYAEIISTIYVKPKPGKLTITGTVNPVNLETVIFTTPFAQTYTFKTTPSGTYDVQIAGSVADSVANLIAKVLENETTVNAWVEGSNGVIEHKTSGDGNNVATPGGTWAGVTYTAYSGNNGAYDYRTQSYTFSVNGGAGQLITLSNYGTLANARNIADEIAALVGATAVTVTGIAVDTNNADRIIVRSDSTGVTQTLEFTTYGAGAGTGGSLFTVGDFAVGATISHPASDAAGDDKVVRLYHPADPVFFRNDNRPLIDLADNDKQIHKAFIALKDGYNIDDGTTYSSSSSQTTFTAPNGITFDGPLYLKGGLFLNGSGVTQMNVTNLQVADRVIIANSGEAGSGVDGGSGTEAGLSIDRGLYSDVGLLWYEKSGGGTAASDPDSLLTDVAVNYTGGYWQIDGPIIGTSNGGKSLVVGRTDGNSTKYGTVIEFEQVTIGDGVNTFGTFNGTAIDTPLTNALAALPNGGKIFIKRGNYTLSSVITISTDNITIEGEGAATKISCGLNFGIKVGTINTVAVNNAMFHKIRFVATDATSTVALLQLLYGSPISTSTAVTINRSYRIDAFTVGDNFLNAFGVTTPTVGQIYVATATATPTTWTSTTTVITPVYSRGCMVEKCWFDGASGSVTNLDVDFNEYHGHMLSNNISTTYYTNLP